MLTKHLTFLFICAICSVFGDDGGEQLVSTLEYFSNCKDYPDVTMKFTDIKPDTKNVTFTAYNAKLEVKKDISGDLDGFVELDRCDSKRQSESCQFSYAEQVDGSCRDTGNRDAVLYSILKSIPNFEEKCPLKQGIYEVKDMHADILEWNLPIIVAGYWRMTGFFYDGEDMALCVYMEFDVRKRP